MSVEPGEPPAPTGWLGKAALTCGIASLVFILSCAKNPGLPAAIQLSVIFGILGVVFGAIGRHRANRGKATNGGMALAGIITGAVGLLALLAFLVWLLLYISMWSTWATQGK